jgi:hypothetical protein
MNLGIKYKSSLAVTISVSSFVATWIPASGIIWFFFFHCSYFVQGFSEISSRRLLSAQVANVLGLDQAYERLRNYVLVSVLHPPVAIRPGSISDMFICIVVVELAVDTNLV